LLNLLVYVIVVAINTLGRLATTMQCGNFKPTIWQNVSKKRPFFSATSAESHGEGTSMDLTIG